MNAVLASLIAFCFFAPAYSQHASDEEANTKSFKLNDEVVLTFRRVSPRSYGIEYPDFYMLETEVTNRQFKVYLDANKLTKDDTDVLTILADREKAKVWSTGDVPYRIENESTIWRNNAYPQGLDDHPVALITLRDATNFADWLNQDHEVGTFRLPTWNEWIIAAYGKSRNYPWGDDWDASKLHASYGLKKEFIFENIPKWIVPVKRTEPVKQRQAGRTPEGIYGMLGNVREYIIGSDPLNSNYFNLGSRSMGGGFTDGAFHMKGDDLALPPRQDYWGYSHHSTGRECDLGFRLVFVTQDNEKMLKHQRLFEQRNRAWMTKDAEPTK